ncbi:MHYT domain-containing protein [Nocardia farcinica]|uniref:MHYT domain-containing protein n=1 Tax=Nocardia farcinica TaxID=37329 RepID=UPI0024564311|nr:MHYT domain-containing protein [Nocardia farcinica]
MSYFSMGYWVLGLAAVVSMVGALVGLVCVRQSTESVTAKFRLVWLAAAAVSIGGIGTWLAIFVSMLGVAPGDGGQIRYEVARLVVAGVIAVSSTLAALLVLGGRPLVPRLAGAGLIMGVGMSAMVFVAMAGIHVQGVVRTAWWSITVAAVLAIGTATATLWFLLQRRPVSVLVAAAVLYAVGMLGMHYVRLAGVSVELEPGSVPPPGEDLFAFLVPMFVLGMLSLAVPITAVLVTPDRRAQPAAAPATRAVPSGASVPSGPGMPSGPGGHDRAFDAGETMVIGAPRF